MAFGLSSPVSVQPPTPWKMKHASASDRGLRAGGRLIGWHGRRRPGPRCVAHPNGASDATVRELPAAQPVICTEASSAKPAGLRCPGASLLAVSPPPRRGVENGRQRNVLSPVQGYLSEVPSRAQTLAYGQLQAHMSLCCLLMLAYRSSRTFLRFGPWLAFWSALERVSCARSTTAGSQRTHLSASRARLCTLRVVVEHNFETNLIAIR